MWYLICGYNAHLLNTNNIEYILCTYLLSANLIWCDICSNILFFFCPFWIEFFVSFIGDCRIKYLVYPLALMLFSRHLTGQLGNIGMYYHTSVHLHIYMLWAHLHLTVSISMGVCWKPWIYKGISNSNPISQSSF